MYARANAKTKALDNISTPKSFPAPFEEVLKLLMIKKRQEDRMKCYRDYVRHHIETRKIVTGGRGEDPNLSVEDETENWIKTDMKDGFKKQHYLFVAESFLDWLPKYEAENRRNRARAGAVGLKRSRLKIKQHPAEM